MTNKLLIPITSIWLAVSVAACGSSPSGTSQQSTTGGSSTSSGGSAVSSSGGGNGGSSTGSTGGSSSGATAGSTASNTGGTAAGNTSGGTASNTGGSPVGNTGGAAAGSGGTARNTGGTAAGGAAGGTTGNTGGSTAGGTKGNTGGQAGGTGGAPSGGSSTASGGVATGGAATGGGAAVPNLVTSGPNAYWNTTGQLTQVTSGTADVNVDENTQYQRWDGFGGTFNEMGWDALSVVSSEIPNALKSLFDAQDGANFVYGRLPLGASDYAMSWYTLDDTTGDYAMNSFSIDRDRQKLIPFIKEALKVKPDLHLWASPWVVPSWMMDSSSNMKSDAQTQGAFALYLAKFVQEYAKENLKIEAIHPQNEPGYAQVHWTQSLFVDFFKTYLGPTFERENVTAEIWCGTMSKDPDDTNIAKAVAADPDDMKYVKGFGVQWNLEAAVATLAATGTVMQTEHRCGNYSFDAPYWNKSRYSSTKPQNDHLYGEESWQNIRDWIVSGVNSYSAWNMVLDTNGKSLGGWPQNALLVVDRSAKTLTKTAAYYVFRHFSQYIAVGATRIGTTGSGTAFKGVSDTAFNGLNAVAFKNPDGNIVTQVYNKGDSATTTTVKVGGALYQFDVPAHGWATLRAAP
jgi:glucosylceramidase